VNQLMDIAEQIKRAEEERATMLEQVRAIDLRLLRLRREAVRALQDDGVYRRPRGAVSMWIESLDDGARITASSVMKAHPGMTRHAAQESLLNARKFGLIERVDRGIYARWRRNAAAE